MSIPTVPTDLPVLTDIIDTDGSTVSIPTLTEVIVPSTEELATAPTLDISEPINFYPASTLSAPGNYEDTALSLEPPTLQAESSLNPADLQLILDHFSNHLETVFTEKLDRHLRQLHHQAVHLAIMELKAELPELLNDLLHRSEPDN